MIDPGRARGHDPRNVAIGNEDAIQDRVVAPRCAHAEDVPRLLDAIALGLPRHERVDDFRLRRIGRVHAVETKVRPHGRQAAERLRGHAYAVTPLQYAEEPGRALIGQDDARPVGGSLKIRRPAHPGASAPDIPGSVGSRSIRHRRPPRHA